MSNNSPEYLDRDGMRIAVVRNDQQFQRALQDVTVMAGKAPVDEMLQTNADAAQRKLPFGMMGMFIVVPQSRRTGRCIAPLALGRARSRLSTPPSHSPCRHWWITRLCREPTARYSS